MSQGDSKRMSRMWGRLLVSWEPGGRRSEKPTRAEGLHSLSRLPVDREESLPRGHAAQRRGSKYPETEPPSPSFESFCQTVGHHSEDSNAQPTLAGSAFYLGLNL